MSREGLSRLPDGAGLKFRHPSGFEFIANVKDGKIVDPSGEKRSPSGAAREVDKIVRPDNWHNGWNGWREWEWFTGNGWEKIDSLR